MAHCKSGAASPGCGGSNIITTKKMVIGTEAMANTQIPGRYRITYGNVSLNRATYRDVVVNESPLRTLADT